MGRFVLFVSGLHLSISVTIAVLVGILARSACRHRRSSITSGRHIQSDKNAKRNPHAKYSRHRLAGISADVPFGISKALLRLVGEIAKARLRFGEPWLGVMSNFAQRIACPCGDGVDGFFGVVSPLLNRLFCMVFEVRHGSFPLLRSIPGMWSIRSQPGSVIQPGLVLGLKEAIEWFGEQFIRQTEKIKTSLGR
jgi:hypothetical protein